jgi:hypothetical protein
MWYITVLAPITFAIISISLTLALIFNESFRKDLLAQGNEAKIGNYSVKGVVIVVLFFILMIGLIITTSNRLTSSTDIVSIETSDKKIKVVDIVPVIIEAQSRELLSSYRRWLHVKKDLDINLKKKRGNGFIHDYIKSSSIISKLGDSKYDEYPLLLEWLENAMEQRAEDEKAYYDFINLAYEIEQESIRAYYQKQAIGAASGDLSALKSLTTPPPIPKLPLKMAENLIGRLSEENIESVIQEAITDLMSKQKPQIVVQKTNNSG